MDATSFIFLVVLPCLILFNLSFVVLLATPQFFLFIIILSIIYLNGNSSSFLITRLYHRIDKYRKVMFNVSRVSRIRHLFLIQQAPKQITVKI